MTQNELNSGKGLTRVQIAQRAYDAAQAKADGAYDRLQKAIEAEEIAVERDAGKGEKAIERAKALLIAAGIQVGDEDLGTDESEAA